MSDANPTKAADPVTFCCPHNEHVTILRSCPIGECPFHFSKVSEIFAIEQGQTDCVYYDSALMSNVSPSRTQISALSRHPSARISSKAVRSLYDDALGHMRTLYVLTHTTPSNTPCCEACGYPKQLGLRCVSPTLCKQRREWVDFVISLFKIENSLISRQLVWERFIGGEVMLPPRSMEQGVELLAARDHAVFEAHGKERAGPSPLPVQRISK